MCCYDEKPIENMTHCNNIHFFCLDCARRNAETEIGNSRHRVCLYIFRLLGYTYRRFSLFVCLVVDRNSQLPKSESCWYLSHTTLSFLIINHVSLSCTLLIMIYCRSRFLSKSSKHALSRIQQEEVLRIAKLDGLVNCPFCDYAAICPDVETDKEFRCMNLDCKNGSMHLSIWLTLLTLDQAKKLAVGCVRRNHTFPNGAKRFWLRKPLINGTRSRKR